MNAGMIERMEGSLGRGASAIFAGAVAYAAYGLTAAWGVNSPIGLLAAAAGTVAFFPCSRLLDAVAPRNVHFDLPSFELQTLQASEVSDELILTDTDRLDAAELVLTAADQLHAADELLLTDADRIRSVEPLLLDDVLSAIAADSRVVRLFDRKAMPTPGQLQTRVANHLAARLAGGAQADASKALSQALAELRSSLG